MADVLYDHCKLILRLVIETHPNLSIQETKQLLTKNYSFEDSKLMSQMFDTIVYDILGPILDKTIKKDKPFRQYMNKYYPKLVKCKVYMEAMVYLYNSQ